MRNYNKKSKNTTHKLVFFTGKYRDLFSLISPNGFKLGSIFGCRAFFGIFISRHSIFKKIWLIEMFSNPISIANVICFDYEYTFFRKYLWDTLEKLRLHHSMLVMSFFRPWIRKKKIEFIDLSWRKDIPYSLPHYTEQHDIVSPLLDTFFIGSMKSLKFQFYSDTSDFWITRGIMREKVPHPSTDFQHDLLFPK